MFDNKSQSNGQQHRSGEMGDSEISHLELQFAIIFILACDTAADKEVSRQYFSCLFVLRFYGRCYSVDKVMS